MNLHHAIAVLIVCLLHWPTSARVGKDQRPELTTETAEEPLRLLRLSQDLSATVGAFPVDTSEIDPPEMLDTRNYGEDDSAEKKELTISATKIATRCAPLEGSNYIRVTIDCAHPNAGSNADKIFLLFGWEEKYTLNAPSGFSRCSSIQWNLVSLVKATLLLHRAKLICRYDLIISNSLSLLTSIDGRVLRLALMHGTI